MKRGHSHRPSDAFRIATQIVLRFMGISVRLVQKFIYKRKMGFVWKHSRQSPPVFSTRSRCRHCVCVDALATWLISSNTVTACRRLSDSPTHLLFSVDGSTQIRLPIRHRSQRALFCAASDSAPTPGRVKARMRFFAHQQHDQARDKHGGCGKPETRVDATD